MNAVCVVEMLVTREVLLPMKPEGQLEALRRGTVSIVTEEELLGKLRRSAEKGTPLRVKLGIDPTAPDLHLGFAVVLRKLRRFQDLGHQAVLIVGDYTGLVGDPSGQKKARPQLTYEEIDRNAKTYFEQAGKILDLERVEIVRNGDWFKKLSFREVLDLASKMTVARMLEREDFAKRYRAGDPISIQEFLYCLMQGYDSVMVRADVELGGTDQTFNLLVGRDLQRDRGMEPQVALTVPLLIGTDGEAKMSKSYGNYIGLTEPPREMFGKLMSIPDRLMRQYFELCTDMPEAEIDRLCSEAVHPREAKERLAREIVTLYHGTKPAEEAAEEFRRVFAEGGLPGEIPEVTLELSSLDGGKAWVVKLLVLTGLVPSSSEGRRAIAQRGVRLDGAVVTDPNLEVEVADGMLLQHGKRRFVRVRLTGGTSQAREKG
jgi:tyrosyl-tRNA synthetase